MDKNAILHYFYFAPFAVPKLNLLAQIQRNGSYFILVQLLFPFKGKWDSSKLTVLVTRSCKNVSPELHILEKIGEPVHSFFTQIK